MLILLSGFFSVNISAIEERWLHITIFSSGGRSLSDSAAKSSHLMTLKGKNERKQWEENREAFKSVCLKWENVRDKVWIVLSSFRLVVRAFVSLILVHKTSSQQLLMTWRTGCSREHSDPIRALKASRAVWCPLMLWLYLQTVSKVQKSFRLCHSVMAVWSWENFWQSRGQCAQAESVITCRSQRVQRAVLMNKAPDYSKAENKSHMSVGCFTFWFLFLFNFNFIFTSAAVWIQER